ncbi:hypothetical protein BDM02DRAFT_3132638 [Thelephora ganbajun]|uniref:Uncharacterized protein n=1 Tax=Thelephora ganbajun TaxID=370292 RepID=A0ACB6Z0U5_THEGA|nr:hypothetical protein BDM02DRAFT_3132638 [Thelephora ganbajun]
MSHHMPQIHKMNFWLGFHDLWVQFWGDSQHPMTGTVTLAVDYHEWQNGTAELCTSDQWYLNHELPCAIKLKRQSTCQATLAQSLTSTKEVCKASPKDTHLRCLLVNNTPTGSDKVSLENEDSVIVALVEVYESGRGRDLAIDLKGTLSLNTVHTSW